MPGHLGLRSPGAAMQEETAQRKTSVKCDAPITLALAAGFLWLYSRIPCPTVYLGDPGDSAPPSRPAACPTRPAIPSSRSWVRELARQRLEAGDPGSGLITQGDSDINPIWYAHDVSAG